MLQIASDITIRLDELSEEYVKIRQVKGDANNVIIVEVNGQKAIVSFVELMQAMKKLEDLNTL